MENRVQIRPLMENDFDINGDSFVQFLVAAHAVNNAEAIIMALLEENENILDDDNLHRCFISTDSQIENSENEDSADDENIDEQK